MPQTKQKKKKTFTQSQNKTSSFSKSMRVESKPHRLFSIFSNILPFIKRPNGKLENSESQVEKTYNLSYLIIPVVLLLIVGLGVLLKLYIDSQQKLNLIKTGLASIPTPSEKEIKKIINQVERHLILPEGEPKVIRLNNVETLKKEQQFFSNAKDGDILLVYSEKVILFDPIKDKIIDVAQIRITPSPASEETEQKKDDKSQTQRFKISLLNGTDSKSAIKRAEKLISDIEDIEIINRADAEKDTYRKTLIVNMKNADNKVISSLKKALSASISALPKEEKTPTEDTDILIILGR